MLGVTLVGATLPPKAPPAPPESSADALYETGKELFDSLASDEVKEQYEFPDRAQWDAFVHRLQAALDGDSPAALAQYEPEARAALAALRLVPGSEEFQGWLEERLDYIEAAKEMVQHPPRKPPPALPANTSRTTIFGCDACRCGLDRRRRKDMSRCCSPCLWPAGCRARSCGWPRLNRVSIPSRAVRPGRAVCFN